MMSIGFDPIINVPNASNAASFNGTDSAIGAAVAKMLRNPILLVPRKMNSRGAHNARTTAVMGAKDRADCIASVLY